MELLLDEVLGAQNKLAVLVWDRNRKNDARYFSVGHEYMLVYARDKQVLQDTGVRLREPQAGLVEAQEAFAEMRGRHGEDWPAIQAEWRKWAATFSNDDERRKLGRFTKVGPRGPFRDDGDISWPGGGGPKYEVQHPISGKPTKVPAGGWVYPKKSSFDDAVASGRVVFGADETTLPRQLRYLFESSGLVMPSVQYSYAQTAAVEFQALMGGRVFDNPKNWRDLRRMIGYLTGPNDLIVDFFAGSASAGHAVFDLNATTGSSRRFILIQLDERVAENSAASEAGYATIPQIARDRLKKAAAGYTSTVDTGFRSLRLDTTNMSGDLRSPDVLGQADFSDLIDTVKPDRSEEDLLFEVLLDWGLDLSEPITIVDMAGVDVLAVADDGLVACFASDVTESVVKEIARRHPFRAVFLDAGFASDSARINAEQIFREVSPETVVKAI